MRLSKLLICLILLCSSLSIHAGAADKTVVLVTATWVPYVINDKKQQGYAYDVVKAAFEAVGYKVAIKLMSWTNALEQAEKGQVDGIFPAYYSLPRSKYFQFSNPFLAGPLVLYQKASSKISLQGLDPNNLEALFKALSAYRFGVVEGYANVAAFDDNDSLKKMVVNTDIENLQQLYEGKVDLILVDKLNAQYLLRYMLPAKYSAALVPLLPAIRENNIYVAFAKARYGYQAVLHDFNKGLLKIQKDNTTTQLMSEYIYEFIDADMLPKSLKLSH